MAEPNPEPLLLFLQTHPAIIGPTSSTHAILPTYWFQRDFRKGNFFSDTSYIRNGMILWGGKSQPCFESGSYANRPAGNVGFMLDPVKKH